jgi:hypothetical protein
MKKLTFMLLCAGTVTMFACNKTEKKETDTAVVTENTGTETTTDYDALNRQRASEAASKMAQDLKMDADTAYQRKASTVYYTRATRRRQVLQKYNTDTTGLAAEMRIIDQEADRRFREMLQPEQYKVYETNRTTYYGGFEETDMPSVGYDSTGSTSASAASSGSESGSQYPEGTKIKTKTEKDGDTKTEIEGPDGQTKIKTEGGQTKVKTKPGN